MTLRDRQPKGLKMTNDNFLKDHLFLCSIPDVSDLDRARDIIAKSTILKVYDGKDSGCRCGCNGKYYYPSEDLNDDGIYMAVQQAMDVAENDGVKIRITDDFINISYGNDKAYTIYYKLV